MPRRKTFPEPTQKKGGETTPAETRLKTLAREGVEKRQSEQTHQPKGD